MVLELEFTLKELEKLLAKEKSLKAKYHLEQAIESLKKYNELKKEF